MKKTERGQTDEIQRFASAYNELMSVNIGRAVRQLKENGGFTWRGLAERIGMDHVYLWRIAHERTTISLRIAKKIAEAFENDRN